MEKKYKLIEETTNVYGRILHRIEALKDFGNIKKGDKGGFVENEENLSQYRNCWIYGNAKVYDNAKVRDDAKVYENAEIYSNAEVYDNAEIYGNAEVYDDAEIYGNAKVYGNTKVCDSAKVFCDARVYGNTRVYGNAKVCGNAKVFNNAMVFGHGEICGNVEVFGHGEICGDAVITSDSDYIVFKNWWSSGRYFTWMRSNDMWRVGCFYGTGKELIEKAYKDSELSGREYERIVKYVESILKNNSTDALCED